MKLKDLKVKEAKKMIEDYDFEHFSESKVLTCTSDVEEHQAIQKLPKGKERWIRSFVLGGFVHYAGIGSGKGLVEFCNENDFPLKTANDRTVVSTSDFFFNCTARNLAVLSKVSGVKIGKGLLYKIQKVHHVVGVVDSLLERAREMKEVLED